MAQVFSCEFSKISKSIFFTNTSGRPLLLLAFQKQPPEVFYEKGVLEKLTKFTEKHMWFAKFSRIPFLQNTSATATLLKSGTANSVLKTLDEYSLSINTNLKNTIQVHNLFLSSMNFLCIFSLVYTVYYQKQPPD